MGGSCDQEIRKALAGSLHRPLGTLIALAPVNDPFAIGPPRQEAARWFAKLWRRLNLGEGVHVRRVHYQLVSLRRPPQLPNGKPYENTVECWNALCTACRDARYLDLVPADAFVDRRNDEQLSISQTSQATPRSTSRARTRCLTSRRRSCRRCPVCFSCRRPSCSRAT